jgi:rhodanese-related sulfurtransferase
MAQLVEFASNHLLLVSGLIGAWLVVMVYEMRLKAQTLTSVGTADSVRLINKGAIVIDVRSSDSYKDGHIVNSRNIELDALANDKAIAKKKNKTFLTVCDDGAAASKAASALREAGIENAFSLKGGIRGWQAENLPLVK